MLRVLKVVFCLWVTCLISSGLAGQEDSTSRYVHPPAHPSEYAPITVSYFGNMIVQPGIKLGMDFHLFYLEKIKPKRRKTKTIRKVLYTQPNLSFYSHPKSTNGLQVNLELGWRRYNNKLYYTEVAAALGYLRRFNRGETYIADANGNITSTKKGTSRGYLTPALSFGGGKIFRAKTWPFAIYTRLNAHLITGYNSGAVLDASWELGIRLHPYSFGIFNTKTRTKIKKK